MKRVITITDQRTGKVVSQTITSAIGQAMCDAIQDEVDRAHYKYDIPRDDIHWAWQYANEQPKVN